MAGFYIPRRWDPLGELQREMGRLFEGFEPLMDRRSARTYPPVNLYDAGDRYILTAELPGLEPGSLDLALTGETLTLRGERARAEGIPDESYRRQERKFGRWSRSLTLPGRVEASRVAAQFAQGTLIVTLPKAEEARPRQIPVTAADE